VKSVDKLTGAEWHRKQAVENFNKTWDLLEQKNRTREDDLEMIHTAHASRFHWEKAGGPLNYARGEWQISRVYSILNMGDSALLHAEHSLYLCIENGFGDFDLAFAYEAISRAHMVRGNETDTEHFFTLAKKASEQISKNEDREYFLSELNSIKIRNKA
jgi:hypothetical protein